MKLSGFKSYLNIIAFDGIALDASGATRAECDENGVPVAWRLLSLGDNEILKNGEPGTLTLTAEDMDSIIGYHRRKGGKIPLDSEHFLHRFAQMKQLDESEVLRMFPRGVAAMGFGSLALRDGDLWTRDVEWNPTAYKLMKEKAYRYFSPVIRGLCKPPLRVTSVALDNEPAINNLDMLVASAEDDDFAGSITHQLPNSTQNQRSKSMKALQTALAKLLGQDTLVLEAEGENTDIAVAVEAKAGLIRDIREALKLAEDVTDEDIVEALVNALEKAGGAEGLQAELDSLKNKVDEMAASADRKEHARLIDLGLRQGKITPADQEWWKALDTLQLSAKLPNAPVVVPVDKINLDGVTDPDTVALSESDRAVARQLGVSEENMLNTKKQMLKK